ncbi:lipase secretion chaperone [Aurantivibrio plasticivorans]
MKRWYYITAAAALVFIVGSAWLLVSHRPPRPQSLLPPESAKLISESKSLNTQWQWQAVKDRHRGGEKNLAEHDEIPFDVIAIHDALADVQIDGTGNVVIDESALPALELAFHRLGGDVSADLVAELQSLVQIGLPGTAGEQVAELLGLYYRYRLAVQSLSVSKSSDVDLSPIDNAARDLESLAALRREHFDHRTALDLFGAEEAHHRYLLSRRAIQQSDMSQQDRQLEMKRLEQDLKNGLYYFSSEDREIYDTLHNQSASVTADSSDRLDQYLSEQLLGLVSARDVSDADSASRWKTRVSQFLTERNAIVTAGLSEDDKITQISWLMSQHFSESEIATADDYLPRYRQLQ